MMAMARQNQIMTFVRGLVPAFQGTFHDIIAEVSEVSNLAFSTMNGGPPFLLNVLKDEMDSPITQKAATTWNAKYV